MKVSIDSGAGYKQVASKQFSFLYNFTEHKMATGVDGSSPHDPQGVKNVFYQSDSKAYTWANLDLVAQATDVRWEWYEPNITLYSTSTYSIPAPSGGDAQWDWYRVWGWIDISGAAARTKTGDWHVDVSVYNAATSRYDKVYTDYFEILESPNVAPTVVLTSSTSSPIETQPIALNITAADSTYLDKVSVYWDDGTIHSQTFESIHASTFTSSVALGSFKGAQTVSFWAAVSDTSGNMASNSGTLVIGLETVSSPSKPDGSVAVPLFRPYGYSSGVASTTLGAIVQYQFDWGDGVLSEWGGREQTHLWNSPGTQLVRSRARSEDRPERVSAWSQPLSVTVLSPAVVNAGVDASINEAGTFSGTGWFNDADSQSWTATVDYGDGSGVQALSLNFDKTFQLQHLYSDNKRDAQGDLFAYVVTVTVTDNDGLEGSDTLQVMVNNVPPNVFLATSASPAENEGTELAFRPIATFTDPGFTYALAGTQETFTYRIEWGDGAADEGPVTDVQQGAPGRLTQGSFGGSHVYADNGTYTVNVKLRDDDMPADGWVQDHFVVTVNNVAPTLEAGANRAVTEGQQLLLDSATFNDKGTLDTHTAIIDWGDGTSSPGTVTETPFGPPGSTAGINGRVSASHVYADNGTYLVAVRIRDDDMLADVWVEDSFTVTVSNVAPTATGKTLIVDEGTEFTEVVTEFNDKGTLDTHTATIYWGDGTSSPGTVTETPFGPPGSTAGINGSVSGTHSYPDDGFPTVTVAIRDDDEGQGEVDTHVTVRNVAPAVSMEGPSSANEGALWRGTVSFVDPGLDTWTVTIDWGDGSTREVKPVFDKSFTIEHVYADDGTYPLIVTIKDDDLGSGRAQLPVTVLNVKPSLWIRGMQTDWEEGTEKSISDIGMFTDPGFDNPANPFHQPGGSHETFTGHIDWGDLSSQFNPPGTVDIPGGPGKLTRGTFDGTHTYADDGRFYAKLWATDDDGGRSAPDREMTILVKNVAPKDLQVTLARSEISEGETAHATVTFVAPGLLDPHRARIDWGDGSPIDEFPVVPVGARSFTRDYRYEDDNPTGTPWDRYTITVTVLDDDGGVSPAKTADIRVNNVAPAASANATSPAAEGAFVTLTVAVADPGIKDTFRVEVHWGDGTSEPPPTPSINRSYTFTHVYADNGAYAVGVRVTDDDTGTGETNVPVSILNVPPVVTGITVDSPVLEGALVSLAGIFTDKGTLDTSTFADFKPVNWRELGSFPSHQVIDAGRPLWPTWG